MTPLFCDGSFNRNGKKMRAVLEREITDGQKTYRIWRKAGNPNIEYPRTENDKYLMHIELNGYLVPFRMTYFRLLAECGYHKAMEKLYGGDDGRRAYFSKLRENGDEQKISEALAEEREEIERCGEDPENQVKYIQRFLCDEEKRYLCAKENNGDSFPSYIGALLLNELEKCAELASIYRAKEEKKRVARETAALEEERAYCEEQNKKADEMVEAAIEIVKNGGMLKNEQITFYQGKYDCKTYSIVNYLMRMYEIDVPIRTQGWVNEKLSSVSIEQETLQAFYRKGKGRKSKYSEKFFDCMFKLMHAIRK